ncbi:hypothetical protein [Burkholderia lata]|uniref:hypothetical protein n=1 Tax=Burkholderia lata (strain ATCC 17760 / DSM 23089 / LMG 22485 / NCIMB 9086 / R18194 / 383) TaxID=482957 RepID=UPI001583D304
MRIGEIGDQRVDHDAFRAHERGRCIAPARMEAHVDSRQRRQAVALAELPQRRRHPHHRSRRNAQSARDAGPQALQAVEKANPSDKPEVNAAVQRAKANATVLLYLRRTRESDSRAARPATTPS